MASMGIRDFLFGGEPDPVETEAADRYNEAVGRMNRLGQAAKKAAREGRAADYNDAIEDAEREARDWGSFLGF
jgi:hypothetical protein